VAAFLAAYLALYPVFDSASEKNYAFIFGALGMVAIIGLGTSAVLEIAYEKSVEKTHAGERTQDLEERRKEREALQVQIQGLQIETSQHTMNLTQLKTEFRILHSHRKKAADLDEGLPRDTLRLSNEIMATWAEHQADEPLPAALMPKNSPDDSSWHKHQAARYLWNQKFATEFFPNFRPSITATVDRLEQDGHISSERAKEIRREFATGFIANEPIAKAKWIGEQLGAIALNMKHK
jgi:hypothetical protein